MFKRGIGRLNNAFPPNRRNGFIVASILILILVGLVIFSSINILQGEVDIRLGISLLVLFGSIFLLFLIGSRTYGLYTARYTIDRDYLLIDWGLRKEKIPLSDIEWMRGQAESQQKFPLPLIRFPGQILGSVFDHNFGTIEYFASEVSTLIFIGTSKRILAISPNEPNRFINTFNRQVEMGSLEKSGGRSENANLVFLEILRSDLNRIVLFLIFFLNIGIMVWVTYLAPKLNLVSLGFGADLTPLEPVAGSQIILIPILSWILSLFSFFLGMVLYQFNEKRNLAKMLWMSNLSTTFLLILSIFFLLQTGVYHA